MKYLRTVSTHRLLALIAGLVVLIVGGTAIAVAASNNGPVPPRSSLAAAIHRALNAPAVDGISARVSFTNSLINASDIPDGPSDPLLQGAPTGRLWLGDHRLRIELQSDNGDAQIVLGNGRFWIYDPMSNTVYKGNIPAQLMSGRAAASNADARTEHANAVPSIKKLTADISHLGRHTRLSGAIPSDVAGIAAYTVRVAPPRGAGGLLGNLQLAWDAARGVPLRFAVYARGNSSPVLELKATDISYGRVSPSVFNISPPPGAKVVRISIPSGGKSHTAKGAIRAKGWTAYAPMSGLAPATAGGLSRRSVSQVGHGGILALYGRGLGTVAVLEQPTHGSAQAQSGGGPGGLNLATTRINGATATELDTALGTLLRFTRNGVSYTVIGSVTPSVARAVARGL